MTTIKNYLMNVKIRGNKLFIRVEQGMGKYSRDVFVIYLPMMKQEVHKWLNGHYKEYLCKEREALTTALQSKVQVDDTYTKSVMEFIAPVMEQPWVMKLNSFRKKYKSYAQAVQPKENVENKEKKTYQKEENK